MLRWRVREGGVLQMWSGITMAGRNVPGEAGSGVWSLLRGRVDGGRWAREDAGYGELAEWSDFPDFEHYMGAMPFPYDIEPAMNYYEAARAGASNLGFMFSHQYYAAGFLESVYEVWKAGPPRKEQGV